MGATTAAGAMRTVTGDEVIRAIDAAAERDPGGAIAFDGDGTLWSGDIGEDFFELLLEHGLHASAREPLATEAGTAGLDASGDALTLARRLHAAYVEGRFGEERMCEIITWAPVGMTRVELERFCAAAVITVGLRDRLHHEAIAVLEHARRVGIEVFLVSASPRAIVDQAARTIGVHVSNVVAVNESCSAEGIVEPAVVRPITYGTGKVTRLRERLGRERVLYAAFGDNAFDVPLLLDSRHPVAVRPKSRLLARASDVPDLVVLASP